MQVYSKSLMLWILWIFSLDKLRAKTFVRDRSKKRKRHIQCNYNTMKRPGKDMYESQIANKLSSRINILCLLNRRKQPPTITN